MLMDPLIGASLISAGSSLLGGFLGDSGSTPREYPKRTKAQMDQNLEIQRKSFYDPIQVRVEDAKKAGLHPLYALGASANFSPVSTPQPLGQSPTGTSLGEGIAEAGRRVGNLMAQNALTKSQVNANNSTATRNEAEAALALSQIKRAEGEANFTQDSALWKDQHLPLQPKVKIGKVKKLPNMYIPVWDNLAKKQRWALNSELNLEAPESVGGYFLAQGALYGPDGKLIKRNPTPLDFKRFTIPAFREWLRDKIGLPENFSIR